MSDKARRSNAWDDQHLTGVLWPVKAILKAFSSITLAVVLLSLVMLYGISASVPAGLLALIPTLLLYALTLVVTIAAITAIPVLGLRRLLATAPRATRFLALFATFLACVGAGAVIWYLYLWPQLRYDPIAHHGLRLFAGFVEQYKSTTLRRLPGMEMSELEYYAWWPLRVILLTFVVNMVTATIRRIEFTFRNLGVLTVHTGIITIALGSVYYSGLKQEGDTVLLAGNPDPHTGEPGVGPPQEVFYDNTRVALYASEGSGWEQRPLHNIPRYNDYNLGAVSGSSAWDSSGQLRPWAGFDRPLSIPVPSTNTGLIDPDISLRVIGYAGYAEPVQDWVKADPAPARGAAPLRFVYLHSTLPDNAGRVSDDPVFVFTLPPFSPAERATTNGVFGVEYTMGADSGMTEQRWRDLSERLPPGTLHALVVETPAAGGRGGFRSVYPVKAGSEITVGDTGFKLGVKQLAPEPPFPIITEGYRGATSSIGVVTVTPPAGDSYDRYVYARFPQINQDLLKELKPNGQPKRRDADPSIRISLIEADQLSVYLDEPISISGPPLTRALIRQPGGELKVLNSIPESGRVQVVDKISLTIGERWADSLRVERPRPVPASEQKKENVGTHDKAMLGLEVTASPKGHPPFRQIVWLPYTRYISMGMGTERKLDLPDGRAINLAFGRLQHALPGFQIRLVDFQMIAYDHRGAPRDYQSVIRVIPKLGGPNFEMFDHETKLNNPLQAPFRWDDDKSWFYNAPRKLASGMNPNQFKFSQAGWDQQGWDRTQALADQGQLKRAFASFTILGVGNNPGIHMIAAGAVLMAIGIPWAFYIKPWLVRLEKKKIQQQLAAGTYQKPQRRVVTTVATAKAQDAVRHSVGGKR